jgi:hypothetical protein
MFNNFFPSIVSFMRQCGKYDETGQDTDDNVIRGVQFSRRIAKVRKEGHAHNITYNVSTPNVVT